MSGLFGNVGTTATATSATNTTGDISKDVALNSPPEDSISDLAFSPVSNHLAVSSWDKKVRIYEINDQGQSEGKALFEHEAPVLNCCWSPDGTKVVGAGADKAARLLDLGANATTPLQVAAHDAPIRCCEMIPNPTNSAQPLLITGSWDKKVKYWDLRQQTPIAQVECQERVYTMDVKNKLLVIGTADRYINIINLDNPTTFYKTMQSPLKWQTRVVSCFADATGFAVGSIEGRCAIQYVEEKDSSSNFSFKCHRETPANNRDISNIYAVNAISFHPVHGTFSTAGSDGTFHFWDKDAKHRLKGYPNVGGTIPCTTFNRDGSIFAYAVSYDWSKGYTGNTPQTPNKVMLHPVNQEEVKPRPNARKPR
ncbi:nuclear pore complex protein (SonA), putative [Talaromyces stipitatus ATCC 10500]|uniref:WD40 repeat protein poxJ n=1 Tax=Talaromyces stipitatus (strain ATCC 10500 / CBS 375.48 / QM 6759 / NRRL 1006) TaxID=441959 RepID=B8M732_TALSN|nr:nuclear pore complex protein (SonA), putative [Talaromyces stipitatus ATCC 10500]EED20252.1 nuclear pore complex protein (SonA), putative [Talaromyces stipitatus ATCC 10500]